MTVTDQAVPVQQTVTPIPAGRSRWRFTIHTRMFAGGQLPNQTAIAEVTDARSRRLTQAWCKPAQLTFTLDGRSPSAASVQELTTDMMAWRWDETLGRDVCMFRGVVAQSQDSISEQAHTVTFTCHDYLAMMARRYITSPTGLTLSGWDQDAIAGQLVAMARTETSATGTSLSPGSYLPILTSTVAPAGGTRAGSGQIRDRVYAGQTNLGEALAQLAAVQNGFDFDCWPGGSTQSLDTIRVFYPSQGQQRPDVQLVYGSTVSALSRSFNSTDYANYQRVIGNNGTSTPGSAQLYGEAWNTDANNVSVAPQGLWMAVDNASDVSVQATLNERVAGALARSGVVVPSYTLTLRPGFYSYGNPNMGDTVPLVVNSGRLAVDTTIRVLGIDYVVGDDGQEDVQLTVGRADTTLTNLFTAVNADVNALARR